MIDSCRLLPTWIQSTISGLYIGSATLITPIGLYFLSYAIIIIQLTIILFLIQKNIVYRKISKLENAIKRKVIWVQTKEDRKELNKKRWINLVLVLLSITVYFHLTNTKLLIINSLFCLLFFLKILFYLPLVSIRIFNDDEDRNILQIINEKDNETEGININEINEISFGSNVVTVHLKKEIIDLNINFLSTRENERVFKFLKKQELFKIERKINTTVKTRYNGNSS